MSKNKDGLMRAIEERDVDSFVAECSSKENDFTALFASTTNNENFEIWEGLAEMSNKSLEELCELQHNEGYLVYNFFPAIFLILFKPDQTIARKMRSTSGKGGSCFL